MSVSHDSLIAQDTPLKRRKNTENSLQMVPIGLSISEKIGEGSYYKIFLSNFGTVVRIAKKKGYNAKEIEILKIMKHKQINSMIRYWMSEEHLHMEMEHCKNGNLKEKILKLKKNGKFSKNFAENSENLSTSSQEVRSSSEISLNSDLVCATSCLDSLDDNDQKRKLSNPFNSTDTEGIEDTLVNGDFDTEESNEIKLENVQRPKWVLNLMRQLSCGLVHIHSMNVIHMDIKPSNILIKGSLYKICDFNISEIGEGEVDLDGDGVYMAPEILGNRRCFSSDVFSLGLIYLELCNLDLELPARGERYRRLRSNNFRGWRVDAICRRMLDKDPEKRCSSSEVFEYFKNISCK